MITDSSHMRRAPSLCFVVVMLVFCNACSLPKIIVLNDPLNAEEHIRLGRIYEAQGNADLAMQQYEAAAKLDPKSVTAFLLLGDLSFRSGKYDTAESAYKKAISLQPGNGDIYNNLCLVYLKQDRRLDKAEGLIKKALIATPAHRGYYLDTWGMILLKYNRLPESITALREAVELIPGDQPEYLSEAYTHLADAYRRSGDEDRAREAEQAAEAQRK